jgi:hypothetical protein
MPLFPGNSTKTCCCFREILLVLAAVFRLSFQSAVLFQKCVRYMLIFPGITSNTYVLLFQRFPINMLFLRKTYSRCVVVSSLRYVLLFPGDLQTHIMDGSRTEPKNRFQGTNSARLCSLAGLYDKPIPTRFLAPIDCLKIPAEE